MRKATLTSINNSDLTTIFLLISLMPQLSGVVAQQPNIYLKRATDKITIDGVLDEQSWYRGEPADSFWQYFPSDSTRANLQTEIFMTYDNEYLYVAAKCYSKNREYITPSLKRDYRAGGNDNLSLMFDTYDDQTNAFLFGMNPFGVRREALIANGGLRLNDFSTSWDNEWYGESKIYDTYWTCELAIPFKTLRFKDGAKRWAFNSYRFDTQINERSTWVRIPRNQWIFNLAFMGKMHWEEAPPKSGNNVILIPYATGNYSQDFENKTEQPYSYNFGGDAKIGITSSLNLDLTANPDFSQVEVDQQVTDLNRFEIFFPERRQFFLENADLFSNFGARRIKPFFSRRIGIAADTTGTNFQNPIYFGARLSGKLDKNWRIGLMNMQTGVNGTQNVPALNYTVAAVQRKVFTRSNVGAIFVNQQAFNEDSTDYDSYNRVFGLDYNLASRDNVWTGKFFYMQSLSPNSEADYNGAFGLHVNYQVNRWRAEMTYHRVGDGFDAQVGFVPRTNLHRISPELERYFYPRNNIFNQHSIRLDVETTVQPDIGVTDNTVDLAWQFEFANSSRMSAFATHDYIYLIDEFDPSGLDSVLLATGSEFTYWRGGLSYSSDRRKKVFFSVDASTGQYFGGTRTSLNGNATLQFTPFGFVGLDYSYNYIQLPDIKSTLILLGPRIDVTFTKSLFLTTFIQYNNQTDNININARLQWRFKPVSDFFLVYTDNYYASDYRRKQRALVAKFTYWLNM